MRYIIAAVVGVVFFVVATRYFPWKRLIDWLGRF